MTHQDIFSNLASAFSGKVGELQEMKASSYQTKMGTYVEVTDISHLRDVCLYLRDTNGLEFNNLLLLSTLDNGDDTLSVTYHLESTTQKHYIALKVTVPANNAVVPSVTNVWSHANWHEREGWDMMGIQFVGHPDLRRILLDDDYPGHPLRKNFKVPEFYHGMKVPY